MHILLVVVAGERSQLYKWSSWVLGGKVWGWGSYSYAHLIGRGTRWRVQWGGMVPTHKLVGHGGEGMGVGSLLKKWSLPSGSKDICTFTAFTAMLKKLMWWVSG
jgi:hypothetical protein